MRGLIFLISIFSASASFAIPWEKGVLTEYAKAKSYQELFCGEDKNQLGCKEHQKSLGDHFNSVPLKLIIEDGHTVTIQGPSSQVRISRKSETKYLLNGRNLDLAEIQTWNELRTAFQKAIPKRNSTGGSIWISTVWAQEAEPALGVIDEEIIASLAFLVERSQALGTCQAVSAFVDACIDKGYVMGLALGQTDTAMKGLDSEEKERQVDAAQAYLAKMKKLAANLKRVDTPMFRAKVVKCAKSRPELPVIFIGCAEDVKTYSRVLEKMKSDMDTQFLDEAVQELGASAADYEALEFFASPQGKGSSKAKQKSGSR